MNHTWQYCNHCERAIVICGGCGNNTCSGGENCKHCSDAYKLMFSGVGCPFELKEREMRVAEIFKLNLSEVKLELKKPLTMIEVEALLERYNHLLD